MGTLLWTECHPVGPATVPGAPRASTRPPPRGPWSSRCLYHGAVQPTELWGHVLPSRNLKTSQQLKHSGPAPHGTPSLAGRPRGQGGQLTGDHGCLAHSLCRCQPRSQTTAQQRWPRRSVMHLPAQDQPQGARGSSRQPGGRPLPVLPAPRFPRLQHGQDICTPSAGTPSPLPTPQNQCPGGADPRPRRSSLLCTARPLRCCAQWTAAAKAPLPAGGPCSKAPPPTPILREHPQEPQSGAGRDGRASRSELWPPCLNQDPPHSRQPRPVRISETSSISHPTQHPPCL